MNLQAEMGWHSLTHLRMLLSARSIVSMTPADLEARLLYHDGPMPVIDKPAGLPVHGGPGGGWPGRLLPVCCDTRATGGRPQMIADALPISAHCVCR